MESLFVFIAFDYTKDSENCKQTFVAEQGKTWPTFFDHMAMICFSTNYL